MDKELQGFEDGLETEIYLVSPRCNSHESNELDDIKMFAKNE